MGMCVYSDVEGTAPDCMGVCKVCKYWVEADVDAPEYVRFKTQPAPADERVPEHINGCCKIMVRFHNNAEHIKFCKMVLRHRWEYDTIPDQAYLDLEFHTVEDLEMILRKIAHLLQLGFDVYSANWKLATETKPIIERKE